MPTLRQRRRRAAPSRRLQPSSGDVITLPDVDETDWVADLPGTHGMASAELERVLSAGARLPGLRSLVVVRDGALIGERYYHGALPSHLLPINSVTKSVSSLLIGLAIERGSLSGPQATVRELLPDAVTAVGSALAGVTLQQILQGRSGVSFEIGRAPQLLAAPDPDAVALALPAGAPSASGWTYNDAAVSLLTPILQRAEGLDLATIAARDLFAPLGIRRFAWRRDRRARSIAYAGLALRTRDLAKLAWTVLQQGRWRDRQVLPEAWVAESTRAHGPAGWLLPPMRDIGYGYLWFTGCLNGTPLVWGLGYGGQWALLAPTRRLVIATAATSPSQGEASAQMAAVRTLVAQVLHAAA